MVVDIGKFQKEILSIIKTKQKKNKIKDQKKKPKETPQDTVTGHIRHGLFLDPLFSIWRGLQMV